MMDARRSAILPWILLGMLTLAAGGLLVRLTSGIGFVTDEWNLLFLRPAWNPNAFLEPFHEHIIIAPTLIYKVLQAVFGMSSNRPFQLVAILGFLSLGPLLFIWMRRRVGDWAGLIAVALILFLGAAFEDLLWAFQVGYFGSLACGLGALIALDRDDRRGDAAAAVLLVGSLTFSSLGMPFVAGAAVEWLTNPRERGRRWLIPGAAVAFYVAWWVGWGHSAESAFDLANLPEAPRFVFDAASSGVTSLLGLATGDGSEADQPHLIWGRIGLAILLALSVWRLWRTRRIPSGVIISAAIALTFFGLAALGQNDLRLPTSSRYQLPGALFLLLFFTEILRGIELKPMLLAGAATVVLITSLSGVSLMREQAETRWVPASTTTSTYLGAVDFAGGTADPELILALGPGSEVPVARFLDQVDSSGSPGYSAPEIEASDATVRTGADQTLIGITGPWLSGQPATNRSGPCSRHRAGAAVPLPADRAEFEIRNPDPGRELGLSLSRFGDPPGLPTGSVIAGSRAWLQLPVIDSPPGWKLTADGPFALCLTG